MSSNSLLCVHKAIVASNKKLMVVCNGFAYNFVHHDGICGAPTKVMCCEHKEIIISDLERTDLVLHAAKNCLSPH